MTGAGGDTLRSWRLRERLVAQERFTPEEVRAIHFDSVNPGRRDIVRVGLHLRDALKRELSTDAQSPGAFGPVVPGWCFFVVGPARGGIGGGIEHVLPLHEHPAGAGLRRRRIGAGLFSQNRDRPDRAGRAGRDHRARASVYRSVAGQRVAIGARKVWRRYGAVERPGARGGRSSVAWVITRAWTGFRPSILRGLWRYRRYRWPTGARSVVKRRNPTLNGFRCTIPIRPRAFCRLERRSGPTAPRGPRRCLCGALGDCIRRRLRGGKSRRWG